MPAVNVNIQPEIIQWALNQTQMDKLGDKLKNNIYAWLNGSKKPTFNQIEEFSKKSNIPLGYFFLKEPPVEQFDLLEYRTVDSLKLAEPSRNLIDTIIEMEEVQNWMRQYRQDFGFDPLPVVGCVKGEETGEIVERIRKDLDLDECWYKDTKSARESFKFIREKLDECGILVMMSGIVGSNTHRALDVNEFRAFTMLDDWAPLIFINAADSNNAMLFSLLHELVHIWVGENDFFNDRQDRTAGVSDLEKTCNAAAAELLVPKRIFLQEWNSHENAAEEISALAGDFHCGEVVIARRALDCRKIRKEEYEKVVQRANDQYNELKESKKRAGGNYYNTQASRLDGDFVKAVCESINAGRTTYTEAYHLTNTNSKTFHDIAQRLGAEGC